jgi:predicted ATPase/class 3 adenylate cyclase
MDAASRAPLPSGTVTFLFTDVEDSTGFLAELGEAFETALENHARIVREAVGAHGGVVVRSEGDGFFVVFTSAPDAVAAAVDAQRALVAHAWPAHGAIRVRMGLHTGLGRLGGDDYIGLDVHRAARIAAAAHGGQVFVSDATRALAAEDIAGGVTTLDLGEHRLKGLLHPERLWQLAVDGLPTDPRPPRTPGGRAWALPVPATSLVGRERELTRAGELIATRRLLTLTGPGGTGKTRLAIALAERHAGDFADGAIFVALSDAVDRPTVVATIAGVLGLRESQERDFESSILRNLRDRELLLVLDNFEQVLAAAGLVADLLAGAPGVRAVVTSRAPLRLSGEQELPVLPLRLPDFERPPSLDAIAASEAVALFVERARAVRPDFVLTTENAGSVVGICARLDGLPLAIELAATRIRVLSPAAILDRLEHSLPLLSTGASDLPDRQRTLRATIDWSYRLLDRDVRRLFARLAVFAGGWTLDAAEEVCRAADDLGLDVLDGLTALIDESLVRGIGSDDDGDRFGMLHVIREFAAAELDASPDSDPMRMRHAAWVQRVVGEAEPWLTRVEARMWQDRLRREEENIRAALRWSIDNDRADVGLPTAGALWRYWHHSGALREGVRWLEGLLALPSAAASTLERAAALDALAGLLYWLGDPERADALYEEESQIHEEHGDAARVAAAFAARAYTLAGRGDVPAAIAMADRALDAYRELGDRHGEAAATAFLAMAAYLGENTGGPEAAVAANERVVEASRQAGRAFDEADALGTLAYVRHRMGDLDGAWEAYRESAAVWRRVGHTRVMAEARFGALLELERGRPERAAILAAAAGRAVDDVGGDLPEILRTAGDPLERATPLLDPRTVERAVAAGRAMDLDELVDFILEAEPSGVDGTDTSQSTRTTARSDGQSSPTPEPRSTRVAPA